MKNNIKKLPINKIFEKIFEKFNPKEIKSIILIGSASRNELTTHIGKFNESSISDIEISVFLKSFFLAIRLKKKKFYIKIDKYDIEILFTHILFYKFLRTPLVYDLKTTGKILWGKDIRKSIWINNPKQIPFWEGVRLLYNRLIPFEVLLWKYVNNLPIKKKEEYNHTKLLIAVGEFLMIRDGVFYSSYKDKLNYFEKYSNSQNKIINQVINALKFKLNYDNIFDNLKTIEFTCFLVYEILTKINPKLDSFRIPLSINIFKYLKRIEKRDLKKFFSGLRIIEIYKSAFQYLECYKNYPEKFLEYGKEIQNLVTDWKECLEIQSSFI
ncbi:MAG: hypothetical protein ACFFAH_01705 [Promethearchaeota archaeon]